MNCPRCDYHSRFTEIACPRCNSKFGLADVEELTHVRYVVSRLERWMGDGLLPGATAEGALREARADIALLERKLGLTITERKPVQLEHASRVPTKTTEDEAFDAFLAGASRRAVTPTPRTATRETTNSSLMDMEPPTTMVVPIPKQAPALLKTPRPQRPTFTWAQVGAYLLSERTLNALLALGAFLILASVLVISTVNPTNLAPIPHVLALVVATLTFFAFGSFVRQRLALTRTGAALLAIAAAFLPLDIWTLGQQGFLDWQTGAVWLVASLLCTPLYLLAHVVLRDRMFGLLTAIAGCSEVMSICSWLGLPLEWGYCVLIVLAIGYVVLSRRIRFGWSHLAWALYWTAQIATPIVVLAMMAARLVPAIWQATTGQTLGALFTYAVASAWWLGWTFYVVCGTLFHRRRFHFAAAWVLPIALVLTITKAPWSSAWYGCSLALLGLAYLAIGWWRQPETLERPRLVWLLLQPTYQVGLLLPLLALAWPLQNLESAAATVGAVAFAYGIAALRFKRLEFRYVAAYLAPVAVGLCSYKLGLVHLSGFEPPWQSLVMVLLAAVYLVLGRFVFLRRRPGLSYASVAREPLLQVALWLTVVATGWPFQTWSSAVAVWWLLAIEYAVAAPLLRQRSWAFVATYALPISFGLTLQEFLGPLMGTMSFTALRPGQLEHDVVAVAWSLWSGLLLAAGEIAARRTGEHRRPLGQTIIGTGTWRSRFASPLLQAGYVSMIITLVVSFFNVFAYTASTRHGHVPWSVIATFLIVTCVLVGSSLARQTSRFLYPATLVFAYAFTCIVGLVGAGVEHEVTRPEMARYLALLGVVYLAVGWIMDRASVGYWKPMYVAGYALSVATPLLAIGDRTSFVLAFGVSLLFSTTSAGLIHVNQLPWFGKLLARPAFGRVSRTRTVASLFCMYLTACLFPLWLIVALGLKVPEPQPQDYGLTLALLAPAYIIWGQLFRRLHTAYRWPWFVAGYALSVLGPLIVFLAIPTENSGLMVVALGVTLGLYIWSTVLHRRGEWLYLAGIVLPMVVWYGLQWLGFMLDSGYADDASSWTTWFQQLFPTIAVGLGLGYCSVALVLQQGAGRAWRGVGARLSPYAQPLIITGYGVAFLGITIAMDGPRWVLLITTLLFAVQQLGMAYVFQKHVFGYVLAGAVTMAYLVGLSMLNIDLARIIHEGLMTGESIGYGRVC